MLCKFTYIVYFLHLVYQLGGERIYYPTLPMGTYKFKPRAAYICNESADYPIVFKVHTSRLSKTTTALVGNFIMNIPFDDSLNINVNMAVQDKIGGWKDNAYIYAHDKGCSILQHFMGNTWTVFLHSLNINPVGCTLPIGNYTLSGFDLALVEQMNFPKQFFYGTYKFKLFYTNKNNDIVGCFVVVSDLVRPWEFNNN